VKAETVAERLVRTLIDARIRRVYGIVGDGLNPVTDAIRRSGTVNWVHVRHEKAAAFAAAADAELTGQLAVRAGT
jgi:pyruvate dehydrogenase (quinone)